MESPKSMVVLFDPEKFLEKNEIRNINNCKLKTTFPIVINVDDDADDDDDNDDNNDCVSDNQHDTKFSYQMEFEKIIPKTEMKLEVLKEVPHDDKENIRISEFNEFNEFGKRPRGRPKESKNIPPSEIGKRPRGRPRENKNPKIIPALDSDEITDDHHTQPSSSSISSTSNTKLFNITLGFLGKAKKIKLKSNKRKKSRNSTQSESNHKNELKKKLTKKHGRKLNVQHKDDDNNVKTHENSSILTNGHYVINKEETNYIEISDSSQSDTDTEHHKKSNVDETTEIKNEETVQNNGITLFKKKRGRPKGSCKLKKNITITKSEEINDQKIQVTQVSLSQNDLEKKSHNAKGRPLSSGAIVVLPRKRPGRPPGPLKEPKKVISSLGRPRGPPKPPKKYAKPGRPKGPPKPPKIPGKRGRKAKIIDDTLKKSIKIPGRRRGRPSFKSLSEMKMFREQNNKNIQNIEIESKNENNVTAIQNSNVNETFLENAIETISIDNESIIYDKEEDIEINENDQNNADDDGDDDDDDDDDDSQSSLDQSDTNNDAINSDNSYSSDNESSIISVTDNNFEPIIINLEDDENLMID